MPLTHAGLCSEFVCRSRSDFRKGFVLATPRRWNAVQKKKVKSSPREAKSNISIISHLFSSLLSPSTHFFFWGAKNLRAPETSLGVSLALFEYLETQGLISQTPTHVGRRKQGLRSCLGTPRPCWLVCLYWRQASLWVSSKAWAWLAPQSFCILIQGKEWIYLSSVRNESTFKKRQQIW